MFSDKYIQSYVTLSISVPFCFLDLTCSSMALCSGDTVTHCHHTTSHIAMVTHQVGISLASLLSLDDLMVDQVSVAGKRVLNLAL